jgi:hypothetical protein
MEGRQKREGASQNSWYTPGELELLEGADEAIMRMRRGHSMETTSLTACTRALYLLYEVTERVLDFRGCERVRVWRFGCCNINIVVALLV